MLSECIIGATDENLIEDLMEHVLCLNSLTY
nr:MAG TPA: hypothetical protein [Caudoviricetes sp.]